MSLVDKQTSQLLKYYKLLGFTLDHEIVSLVDSAANYEELYEELESFLPYLTQEGNYFKICDELAKVCQKKHEECRLPWAPKHQAKFYEKQKIIVNIMLKRYNVHAYTENLNLWSTYTNLLPVQAKRISQEVNLPLEEVENELNVMTVQKEYLTSLFTRFHAKKTSLGNNIVITNDAITRHIRDKYKQMALKSHPDRSGNPYIFKSIAQAYKVLNDDGLRKLYNRTSNHRLFKEIHSSKGNHRSEMRKFAPGSQMALTFESTETVTGIYVSLVSAAKRKSPSTTYDNFVLNKIPNSITPETKRVNVFIGWLPILSSSLLHYEICVNLEDQIEVSYPCRSVGCILQGLQRYIRYTVQISWTNWQRNYNSFPYTFVIDEQYKPVPLYGKYMSKLTQQYNQEMKSRSKNSKKKVKKNGKDVKSTGNNKILQDFKKVKKLLTKNDSIQPLKLILKEYESSDASLSSLLLFSVNNDNLLFFCCKNSKISLENFIFFLTETRQYLPWNLQHPVDKKTGVMNLMFLADFEKFEKYLLIGKEVIDVNLQCELGYSIVHYCVLNNETEYLKRLHSIFADTLDLNLLDFAESFSKTPLHLATKLGNLEMVSLLLRLGALLHFTNEDYPEADISPLFTSLQLNLTDILWTFIQFIENQPEYRYLIDTITHLSVIKDNLTLFKKLVDLGANINLQNADGDTCLHLAFELDAPHFIDYLISLPSIDVNIRNISNFLPEELVATSLDDIEHLLESQDSLLTSSSESLVGSSSSQLGNDPAEELSVGQTPFALREPRESKSDVERILEALSNPARSLLNTIPAELINQALCATPLEINLETVEQTSLLLTLPYEIFACIMFFLSPFDWVSFSGVCKRAYILTNQQYLWHKAYLAQKNKLLFNSYSLAHDWKLLYIRNYSLQLIEHHVNE